MTTFTDLKHWVKPRKKIRHCRNLKICEQCDNLRRYVQPFDKKVYGFRCLVDIKSDGRVSRKEKYEEKAIPELCAFSFEHIVMGNKIKVYE